MQSYTPTNDGKGERPVKEEMNKGNSLKMEEPKEAPVAEGQASFKDVKIDGKPAGSGEAKYTDVKIKGTGTA